MGWATMEEIIYGDKDHTWVLPQGRMHTTGPGKSIVYSLSSEPRFEDDFYQSHIFGIL
jgi:hypothetical protein